MQLTKTQERVLAEVRRGDSAEPGTDIAPVTIAMRLDLHLEVVRHAIGELSDLGLVSGRFVGGISGHLYSPTPIPTGAAGELLVELAEKGTVYHPDRHLARALKRENYADDAGPFAIRITGRGERVAGLVELVTA
jgi:hypothetical protein